MTYAVECYELGFTCENATADDDRSEVLAQILLHLDEAHGCGSGSEGLKAFVDKHIVHLDVPAAPDDTMSSAGARRAAPGFAGLSFFTDLLRRRNNQTTPDEER
jgi:predicted small metal-binding protein